MHFEVLKKHNVATKSLFLNFQKSFSASYFPISQKPLDQDSSLTPLMEELTALNAEEIKAFFQITIMPQVH